MNNSNKGLASCFQIELCFQLNRDNRNKKIILPNLAFKMVAEEKNTFSRVFFNQTGNNEIVNSVSVSQKNPCLKYDVFLKDNLVDSITPIKFNLTYKFQQVNQT